MLMTDHPAWQRSDDIAYRVVAVDDEAVLITATTTEAGETVLDLGVAHGTIQVDTIAAAELTTGPVDLVAPLHGVGTVTRVANPSLWDALSAAIMRQVIQAAHARVRYRRFCAAFGESLTHNGLTAALFPSPDRILALTDEQFRDVGAAFPRSALRAAAVAYLAQGHRWSKLQPSELVAALQCIPRVGPWTARTAVADFTGDFSFYDYSDIALRPAAHRLGPDRPWPATAVGFKAAWEELAGEQLSAWTLLTLAWGNTDAQPALPAVTP
ncbi:hypothetical protein [Nocardia higoensis]|uniref:hypothetical protein n=1 Tax=Nocardia higoensis TaxID=228599 RepID=UPI00030760ED|nr:hypothetical protein [Nocardia higoensis]